MQSNYLIKQKAKIFIPVIILVMLFMPMMTIAQSAENPGLVPCGHKDSDGNIPNPCSFDDVLTLVNNIINFILFKLLAPVAAFLIAVAGFLYLFSGSNPAKRKKANTILWKMLEGMLWALGAWLIIKSLLTILGFDGSWIGFK